MPTDYLALFALLLGLQAKHFLFDFAFQSDWQISNKGIYGHPGGLVHAGLHALGTLVVFMVAALGGLTTLTFALIIAVVDFVIHYHVDWTKSQVSRRLKLQPDRNSYWLAFGADQVAHQVTYMGLVAAWVVWS